ncbi:hypothetical protein RB195_025782 [Necator americanus]|uniref:Uncharacterized protein n=1 Tax=Necator americanus TaxID=51031 RepID=A0ABR1ETV6_NECAM
MDCIQNERGAEILHFRVHMLQVMFSNAALTIQAHRRICEINSQRNDARILRRRVAKEKTQKSRIMVDDGERRIQNGSNVFLADISVS